MSLDLTGYPDYRALPEADREFLARTNADPGLPRVLLAVGAGGQQPMSVTASLLAASLPGRGLGVDVLLCDAALPACQMHTLWHMDGRIEDFARRGSDPAFCRGCLEKGLALFAPLGARVLRYSDFLTPEGSRELAALSRDVPARDIPAFRLGALPVGEHALAGALRFFSVGDLTGQPRGEAVLRHYFLAALRTATVFRALLRARAYHAAVMDHGIYVPQGIGAACCAAAGVRLACFQVAYRKGTFLFSHGGTYHHTLMTEPTDQWEHLELTPAMERDLDAYLKSRWSGSRDWIWFHEGPTRARDEILAQTGLDPERPAVGLLTNVIWDAQLHYPANAFGSMMEWIVATVEHFARRPDVQLLIRVHPAELRGTIPSREKVADRLADAFPALPENVRLIGPESGLSTYACMELCDSVLIYGTKTGVELTAVGIPVVVAGEAWIRGKGLTSDAADAHDYFRILEGLPRGRRLDADTVARARRYAFHFFFRRMIPLGAVRQLEGWPPFSMDVPSLDALAPGRDPGLDTVLTGIATGAPFVYPAERAYG